MVNKKHLQVRKLAWATGLLAVQSIMIGTTLATLPPPTFSHPSGFYSESPTLILAAPEGMTILYTLDGSEPDPDHIGGQTYHYKNQYPRNSGDPAGELLTRSRQTWIYGEPLAIQDRSTQPNDLSLINTAFSQSVIPPLDTTFKATTIRARTYQEDEPLGPVVTRTYFVNPDIASRYDLMIVALSTDEAHLFDYETGMYTAGKVADDWRAQFPSTPYSALSPANYGQRGAEWERPAHIEFFSAAGDLLLRQNIGIRLHGLGSASFPRKSLRFYGRNEYDETNRMEYEFFPGLKASGNPAQAIHQFRRLIMRNSGSEASATLFRDALVHELVRHLPLDVQASQPVIHFINGDYWGIMNLRERQDEHYLASHYQLNTDGVAILEKLGEVDVGIPSDQSDYLNMVQFATTNDLTNASYYEHLSARMDTGNYALYNAIQVYINNYDWPYNNIRYWRKRTVEYEPQAPRGHDGRWRWMLYDTDISFNADVVEYNMLTNRLAVASAPVPASTVLFRSMLTNQNFRHLFINSLADLMNTTFQSNRVAILLDEFVDRIETSRDEHFQRWRNGVNRGDFIRRFSGERPGHVRQHVLDFFQLPGLATLTITNETPARGSVRVNTLLVDSATPGMEFTAAPHEWSGLYFQEVPVALEAVASGSGTFSGWWIQTGDSEPEWFDDSSVFTLNLDQDTRVKVVFEDVVPREVIHYWNFNSELFLNASYTLGGAALSVDTTAATNILQDSGQDFFGENARFGDPIGSHLRVNWPLVGTNVFHLPTDGFEDIVVAYETRRSGSGAGLQIIEYTIDGSDYLFWTNLVITEFPVLHTFDFAEAPDVDDNPQFALRIRFEQGDGGAVGNNRFDNFTAEGRPLPGVNLPPVPVAPIVLTSLIELGASPSIDLTPVFSDPESDPLVYSAESAPPGFVGVSITNNLLYLAPLLRGEAAISVWADDGNNTPVMTTFRALVYPSAHGLADHQYVFNRWSAEEPDWAYPPHMLFLQGDQNDSSIDSDLLYAYRIPADDYAAGDQATIGYPYNNTARTRINGLEENGISFINTGRGRDLGGALLAIDTRGVTNVQVAWVAGTEVVNARTYAIRLQYRIGASGPFLDFEDGAGQLVEYVRQLEAGHVKQFLPVSFPQALLNKEYVQLLWRYYRISGTSGARAQLKLDDIYVGQSPVTANTGVPLAWLVDYGLTNEPFEVKTEIDRDGDSYLVWQEYVADTDPTNPEDSFAPIQVETTDDGVLLKLEADSLDRLYSIEYRISSNEQDAWGEMTNRMGLGGPWWVPVDVGEEEIQLFRGKVELP